jgi:hypothetical protein
MRGSAAECESRFALLTGFVAFYPTFGAYLHSVFCSQNLTIGKFGAGSLFKVVDFFLHGIAKRFCVYWIYAGGQGYLEVRVFWPVRIIRVEIFDRPFNHHRAFTNAGDECFGAWPLFCLVYEASFDRIGQGISNFFNDCFNRAQFDGACLHSVPR